MQLPAPDSLPPAAATRSLSLPPPLAPSHEVRSSFLRKAATRPRRLSWAQHPDGSGGKGFATVIEYERSCVSVGADDYKRNLHALNALRRANAGQRLSFKMLVRQLDIAEGGEALACLPTGTSPRPGEEALW